MLNYKYDHIPYSDIDQIKLPKFQRGFVWKPKQQKDLIQTLHDGFPFGVFLVSSIRNSQNSQLIDGQQRLSTIKKYEKNKVSFYKDLSPKNYHNTLNSINNILKENGYNQITINEFNKYLKMNELADWTDKYDNLNSKIKKQLRDTIKSLQKRINNYINLNELQIPVIEFTGKKEDLPQVFKNLNKGGIPLTRYEIFSATWSDILLNIPENDKNCDEIIDNVKNYYESLTKNGEFKISNYSEDKLREERKINLAEFGRALGKFVVKRIPALITNNDDKSIDKIGFNLLAIISNVDPKIIGYVGKTKHVNNIQNNIKIILSNAKIISNKLNDKFKQYLKQNISHSSRSNSKKYPYAGGISSNAKILSYFADLWDKSEKDMNNDLNNIPSYYVYDFIANTWGSHGDQRLKRYYPYYQSNNKNNYSKPVNKNTFKSEFKNWLNDDNNKKDKKNFPKYVQALITIHANVSKYTEYNGEDYEFEHVIPKNRVLKNDPKLFNVHLSSLGNGMLLSKSLNDDKKDKTLYEYMEQNELNNNKIENINNLIKQSSYFKKITLKNIMNNLQQNNFNFVNNEINNRSIRMANEIIDGLIK
ncbi:hypothetical protein WR164_01730 [Philodulcilactobacillus myokoensis]|uniref:GmrSD restriction endonucleases N-terminal domain-containing protein n=1 Tax=Philodulcilactobacillus myokoensis TaxID=2929573 RepID=A0A9W6ESJ0_9LACO|nr:DUF262 domain-containing protein [Philodulcilactobacillus myokoensis]GLB46194.1 hypothetical protein WR164_01730 [Philodulcilactobacillus myokoensis]